MSKSHAEREFEQNVELHKDLGSLPKEEFMQSLQSVEAEAFAVTKKHPASSKRVYNTLHEIYIEASGVEVEPPYTEEEERRLQGNSILFRTLSERYIHKRRVNGPTPQESMQTTARKS